MTSPSPSYRRISVSTRDHQPRCLALPPIQPERLSLTPQGVCERPERHEDGHAGRKPPLEPSRRAHTDQRPPEQAQVAATRVDQQSCEEVVVAAQMRPAHPAGVIAMRIRSFQSLATAPLQGAPPSAADPPPVGVDCGAGCGLVLPSTPAPVRFGDVGPYVELRQIDERLIAVIPLVGDDLVDDRGGFVRHGGHGVQRVGGCASRIPNSLAEFGIEATLRGVWRLASGADTGHRHHPWQSAWFWGARWQVRPRRRDRAAWAGGGPDVGRGGALRPTQIAG